MLKSTTESSLNNQSLNPMKQKGYPRIKNAKSVEKMQCRANDYYESRGGTSDIRLQTSDFRLQTSDFRLQTSDFRLPTSDFRLRTSYFGLRTWDLGLGTWDFRLQTSDFRLQTSDFRLGLISADLRVVVVINMKHVEKYNRVISEQSVAKPNEAERLSKNKKRKKCRKNAMQKRMITEREKKYIN